MLESRLPKRIARAAGLALIASLALGGMTAASASATTQHWYACQEVAASTGGFTDNACQEQGTGNYEWAKVGTSSAFSLQGGVEPIFLSSTVGGLNLAIGCYSAKASGTIGNPAEGGAGTLATEGTPGLALSECVVTSEPKSCKVKGGAINFTPLKGEATELEGKAAVKLEAVLGYLSVFTVEGCTGAYTVHNGTKKLTGSFYGTVSASASTLQFTKAGSASLVLSGGGGGTGTALEGSAGLHTASGGALRLGIPAPVNTAAPTISPSTPKVGTTLTATTGKWLYAPTSYSYSWLRCDENGQCGGTGGTKSTYTATEADAGYTLKVQVTVSNEGGSGQASSASSAIVVGTAPSWYACRVEAGGTRFLDSACTEMNALEGVYSWVKLASPTGFAMSNLTGFTLTLPIVTEITISCTTQSSGGTMENHAGAAGTISESKFTLSGCTVSKPEGQGCVVPETLPLVLLKGEATESGGQPAIKFSPASGEETLMTFMLSGCKSGAMNGAKTVTGSFTGVWNGVTRKLEFTPSSSGVYFGPSKGSFVGDSKIETSGGQPLKVVR